MNTINLIKVAKIDNNITEVNNNNIKKIQVQVYIIQVLFNKLYSLRILFYYNKIIINFNFK